MTSPMPHCIKSSRDSATNALYCRISALNQGYFDKHENEDVDSSILHVSTTLKANKPSLEADLNGRIFAPSSPGSSPRRPDEFHRRLSKEILPSTSSRRKIKVDVVDPYTTYIFSKLVKQPVDSVPRKPPIINRGTYARCYLIDHVVTQFLHVCKRSMKHGDLSGDKASPMSSCQILCLGSGYDALGLRIQQQSMQAHDAMNMSIFEIDYPETIAIKRSIIDSYPTASPSPTSSSTSDAKSRMECSLQLIGHDLSDSIGLLQALRDHNFNPATPTLIITECVLVYLQEDAIHNLISALGGLCQTAAWVSYDMVNPDDTYGHMMLNNISAAGYQLYGFLAFPTLASQLRRFLDYNWSKAKNCTMLQAYDEMISKEEKHRVGKLEIFDEVEEWQLLLQHYSFSLAIIDKHAGEDSSRMGLLDELLDMIPSSSKSR